MSDLIFWIFKVTVYISIGWYQSTIPLTLILPMQHNNVIEAHVCLFCFRQQHSLRWNPRTQRTMRRNLHPTHRQKQLRSEIHRPWQRRVSPHCQMGWWPHTRLSLQSWSLRMEKSAPVRTLSWYPHSMILPGCTRFHAGLDWLAQALRPKKNGL